MTGELPFDKGFVPGLSAYGKRLLVFLSVVIVSGLSVVSIIAIGHFLQAQGWLRQQHDILLVAVCLVTATFTALVWIAIRLVPRHSVVRINIEIASRVAVDSGFFALMAGVGALLDITIKHLDPVGGSYASDIHFVFWSLVLVQLCRSVISHVFTNIKSPDGKQTVKDRT